MQDKLRHKIDAAIKVIQKHQKVRKTLIKKHETTLVDRLELDLIHELANHQFLIESRSKRNWISFTRGDKTIRVWLPKKADNSTSGHHVIKIEHDGEMYHLLALINHEFVNQEYNYLTMNYMNYLNHKLKKLESEVEALEALKCSDIDGSYVVYCSEPKSQHTGFSSLQYFLNNVVATGGIDG